MSSIGITGSRDGMSEYQYEKIRLILFQQETISSPLSFHHGDCVGVDEQAHNIAAALGYELHIYPPDNDRNRAYCSVGNIVMTHPPESYLGRNKHIVLTVEHLLVVPDSDVERWRSGTWSTCRYAEKIGRQYAIITPDGSEPIRLEKS